MALYSITLPFTPVLENCIADCVSYNLILLSKMIGYMIGCSLYEPIKAQSNFNRCWEMVLENAFVGFNLIQRENKFLKDYIAFHLCGHLDENYFMPVDPLKIIDIGNIIFGDVRNFKIFKKACMIYQNFQSPQAKSITIPDSPNEITIICTNIPKNREYYQDILKVGQKFILTPSGYQASNRIDSLVLFGKHPLCDIRLPDDDQIDDIAFAIYHNGNTFIMIDCSKKSHLKRKIQPQEPLKVNEGMIIDIAYSSLMKVVKIEFYEDDVGQVSSKLVYEFLKGELCGAFGNKHRRFSTIKKDGTFKDTFLVGRGCFGVEPDLRLTGCVGSKHMEFEFRGQEWFLTDLLSKNGTYLLIKNHDQYSDKIPSYPSKLFENFLDGESIDDIVIDRYSFAIFQSKLIE